MKLTIDEHSPTTPFEQLRQQVVDAVRTGTAAPGDKLPTVRRLADELGLAPNTVARAYRELEQGEVIETRGRLGSFIAATGDPTRRQAQRAAAEFAERMRGLGLDAQDALALAAAALGIRP